MDQALVKYVNRGDWLTVSTRAGIDSCVQVAGVRAPRVAVQILGRTVNDQPCAWESREFVRGMLVGKVVTLRFVTGKKRGTQWSEVIMARVECEGQDVARCLLEAGLAVVDLENVPEDQWPAVEAPALKLAELSARQRKAGIWSEEASQAVRQIKWEKGGQAFIPLWTTPKRGQRLEATVEAVEDGHSCVCYFVADQVLARVLMTGIKCEPVNHDVRADQNVAVPLFGKPAKRFVEIRILGRKLEVQIDGHDRYGNVYGTFWHPKGNISLLLLEEGLADLDDDGCACLAEEYIIRLRNAVNEAKDKKRNMWVAGDYQKPTAIPADIAPLMEAATKKLFSGKIVEVHSGDSCTVVPLNATEKNVSPAQYMEHSRRVYLSSIRAPRGKTRDREAEPWFLQAADVLRQSVGQLCEFELDYVREQTSAERGAPASDEAGRLHFVTIRPANGKTSLNYDLLKKGLARVVRYRASEERSRNYDELIAAEKEAVDAKRALHGSEKPPVRRVNDLTGKDNCSKAKAMEQSLKRSASFEAVVESIVAGGRYRVFIPSESILISFILSGITVPATGRLLQGNASETEPFGMEAQAWATLNVLYRTVDIKILTCDRGGSFIGIMNRKDGTSIQESLLKAGLAQTDPNRPIPSALAGKLQGAEEDAVTRRRGMWVLEELVTEYWANLEGNTSTSTPDKSSVKQTDGLSEEKRVVDDAQLAHVNDVNSFYAGRETAEDSSSPLCQRVHNCGLQFEAQGEGAPSPYSDAHKPRRGDLVVALSGRSGRWERGRVNLMPKAGGGLAEVFMLDWGNYGKILLDRMFPCPRDLNLVDHPGLVTHYELALVKRPSIFKTQDDAPVALRSACRDKKFKLTVVGPPQPLTGALPVLLYGIGESKTDPYQLELLKNGLVLIDSKSTRGVASVGPELMSSFQEAEKFARENCLEIWRHGDCTSDPEAYN